MGDFLVSDDRNTSYPSFQYLILDHSVPKFSSHLLSLTCRCGIFDGALGFVLTGGSLCEHRPDTWFGYEVLCRMKAEVRWLKVDVCSQGDWPLVSKRVLSAGNAFVIAPYNDMSVEAESDIPTTEAMFCAEKEILKGIVEHESCVIAGRCGFHVMREQPNHLSVMIQAPMEQRIQRVMTKQGLSHEEAEKAIRRVDKMRENYVTKYTKTSRYDTRNYDLVISMAGKTEDDAVALIMNYKMNA